MENNYFRNLSPRQKCLVCMAVLLDGHEAASYLERDSEIGLVLSKAAADLSSQATDFRMPYVGSLLRQALKELA